MNASEEAVIEQLLKLSEYGTLDEARLEAVRSLALYCHHPTVAGGVMAQNVIVLELSRGPCPHGARLTSA